MTVSFGTLQVDIPGQPSVMVELRRGSTTIGRGDDATLRIDAEGVSRLHARIICAPGLTILVDEESLNGTFVDGRRLGMSERHELRDGDVVQIGPATLRFFGASRAALPALPVSAAGRAHPPRRPVPPPPRPLPPGTILPRGKSRYMRLLPAIYQDGETSFLNRFLLLFESILGPLERVVDELHYYSDPRTAPEALLPWLESWLGLALAAELPPERRRQLIGRAGELYRWRGTRYGMREYLRIVAGADPIIVEPGQPMPLKSYPPLPPHVFLVLFLVPDPAAIDQALVAAAIEAEKPAHAAYYLEVRQLGA
ncbi:MAG TPA: FHA domain-containing protein [Roseiflexaceae bacterium]|nr:FHA domain-containing protein [Roseiflexaceae bacterium]